MLTLLNWRVFFFYLPLTSDVCCIMYAGFIFVCCVLSDLSFHTECYGLLKCVVCGVLYGSQVCITLFPCLLWSTVRLVETCCFLIGVCALTLLVALCVVCCMMAVGCCLLETYIPPPSDMKK